ncbi:CDP-alcohol phosphatidyltransferase family protein [Candidatus Dojkabacteria bacterium]|uniref:CDP-alcohol phosphatidyltransferase family protein n=1 Tax=Candidatus Dojkabacteria bacterium TaxID=2099670 RepID=A0A955L5W2_9BACT|nr:CDP-alcohol phosphatidyltransferase family protein [Candidatus Dojkabacteria bacterium]
MLPKIKKSLQPYLEVIFKPISFISPNILTIIGMVFPLLFLYLLVEENYLWATISLFGVGFDVADGTVARMTKRESAFGGVLDATLDRVADAIILSAFGFANIISWAWVMVTIISSYVISYVKGKAEAAAGESNVGTNKFSVGFMQRPTRFLFILAVSASLLINTDKLLYGYNLTQVIFFLLLVGSVVTVIQRFMIIYSVLTPTQKA